MKKGIFEKKAIIFDMNGVLVLGIELKHGTKIHKSFIKSMANSLKINEDTWMDAVDTIYSKSIEGTVSEKKVVNTIAKNLKISQKKLEKIVIGNYKKLYKENKKLYKYAFNLRKRGHKIAILSDQWVLSKKALVNKKYNGKFDVVVYSCDVGIRKPDPKIYKLCLKKLKVHPENSIFVDNRDWNLVPAKKLGMETILFKSNKQAIKEIEGLLK